MCDHGFLNATLDEDCGPFNLQVMGAVQVTSDEFGAVNSRLLTVRPSTKILDIIKDFCLQVMLSIVLYLNCVKLL